LTLGATPHRFKIRVSDVERDVYEALDLRVARHPSETLRFLLIRTLAYCLEYAPGIAFSKGGLSSTDEPALSVRDDGGILRTWIEVGSPSAERLHRAAKSAERVALYTASDLHALRREVSSRTMHRLEYLEVHRLDPALLETLEAGIERTTSFELVRTGTALYVTLLSKVIEGSIERSSLV
jgi:uncharacterized protein YaeQ